MNKNNYWFKRRRYGFGWTPVTWQGWVSVVVMLAIIFGATYLFATTSPNNRSFVLYLNTLGMTIILSAILAYSKGPSPKWRWGKKHDDNKDEDF
jgi:hypothetical protein